MLVFGSNVLGQLGTGDDKPRIVPTSTLTGSRFSHLACGSRTTFGIPAEPSPVVLGLGSGAHDQMGKAGREEDDGLNVLPRNISLPTSNSAQLISSRGEHVVCLDESGEVFTWGRDEERQLGREPAPGRIGRVPGLPHRVRRVAAGRMHTVVVDENGQAWAWGSAAEGACGIGRDAAERASQFSRPRRVDAPDAGEPPLYKDVACGSRHTLLLTSQGRVFGMGANSFSQLGTGRLDKEPRYAPTPIPLGSDRGVRAVACGYRHSFALLEDTGLMGWGWNSHHQVIGGKDVPGVIASPIALPFFANKRVHVLAAGGRHTLCGADGARVYGWGRCAEGELGLGIVRDVVETPTLVMTVTSVADDLPIHASRVRLACGWEHTVVSAPEAVKAAISGDVLGRAGGASRLSMVSMGDLDVAFAQFVNTISVIR